MEGHPERVKSDTARDIESGGFVERLGERLGLSARASAVFGEPVEQGGVTVIPVAKATWGFGGGSGSESGGQSSGGGGGGIVQPVGFIKVSGGDARFVPFRDPRVRMLRLALASAGAAGWIARRRRA